jgi:serine/threonine protein kinase
MAHHHHYHHHHQNGALHQPPPPLRPSAGARLSYRDLDAAGLVLQPPPESYTPDHHNVTLYRASATPALFQVVPSDPMGEHPPAISLVREHGAKYAYAVSPEKEPIDLGHPNRHPQWGCVVFAVVYRAIGNNAFQAPDRENAKYVAIKRLNKRVVNACLEQGCNENPYKEMARMEELGDNIHVLQHVELLEDDEYLYIVTPQGCTLKDEIRWRDYDNIMESRRSRMIFRKILQILGYLEERGINHHDLSPDNFLFLTPDNLVVYDLALSVRIPINPLTRQRTLIAPQGNFGTYAWMCPIVFYDRQYDGVAMDLWAAGVILYNLLTNQLLYEQPNLSNVSFKYFVWAKGLSSTPLNERVIELLHDISFRAQNDESYAGMYQELMVKATAHVNLSPEAVELLENLLEVDPANRYSLAQAMESQYVQSTED